MSEFYSKYSDNYDDPQNFVASYSIDQVRLLVKSDTSEGFKLQEAQNQNFDPEIKSFIDDTRKLVIDNTGAYGHFMATWMYVLTKSIESGQPLTVIFYARDKHPEQIKTGLVSVTKYLDEELTRRGHRVEYAETDRFYVNNFIHVKNPFAPPIHNLKPVSDFLVENLDPQIQATEKIYLSRRKVTYSFIDRIDDEVALEEYLKTLGFEVICPEDFDSYHDQLNKIASAKILMSLTSSGLSACLVLDPNAWVVELSSFMHVKTDPLSNEYDIQYSTFHNQYKVMSMIRGSSYLSLSNMSSSTADMIKTIESNKQLKDLLSS